MYGALGGAQLPWRVVYWTIPMLTAPMILFTVGVLAADAKRTLRLDTHSNTQRNQ